MADGSATNFGHGFSPSLIRLVGVFEGVSNRCDFSVKGVNSPIVLSGHFFNR